MATPTSVPTVQPQPSAEFYSLSALWLFKTWNRPSYLAAFGVEAPAYDALRRPKAWFDSTVDVSDPWADVTYAVLRNGKFSTATMPANEAATLNLPVEVPFDPSKAPGPALPPEREVPVRQLLPGESFHSNPFGTQIQRADMVQKDQEASGQFTAADRATLNEVLAGIRTLLAK